MSRVVRWLTGYVDIHGNGGMYVQRWLVWLQYTLLVLFAPVWLRFWGICEVALLSLKGGWWLMTDELSRFVRKVISREAVLRVMPYRQPMRIREVVDTLHKRADRKTYPAIKAVLEQLVVAGWLDRVERKPRTGATALCYRRIKARTTR